MSSAVKGCSLRVDTRNVYVVFNVLLILASAGILGARGLRWWQRGLASDDHFVNLASHLHRLLVALEVEAVHRPSAE
jgi:hypothetical protein